MLEWLSKFVMLRNDNLVYLIFQENKLYLRRILPLVLGSLVCLPMFMIVKQANKNVLDWHNTNMPSHNT